MANICMDCLNWRKCPWSKDLNLSFEKRERPPHIEGKPDFKVNVIGSGKNIRFNVQACPMFEDENITRGKDIPKASPLNSTENEKFLKDPIAYINSHTNDGAVSAARKRMNAIKQSQYKKKSPMDDAKLAENRRLVNSLRTIAQDTNVPVITATQQKAKANTTKSTGRGKRKTKAKEE